MQENQLTSQVKQDQATNTDTTLAVIGSPQQCDNWVRHVLSEYNPHYLVSGTDKVDKFLDASAWFINDTDTNTVVYLCIEQFTELDLFESLRNKVDRLIVVYLDSTLTSSTVPDNIKSADFPVSILVSFKNVKRLTESISLYKGNPKIETICSINVLESLSHELNKYLQHN